jgi:glycosyltransferase involved in cell wall biosynthesis
MYLKIGWEGFSINMQKNFYNLSIILPAMDETYSLVQTADIIMETCRREDLAEIIIVICDRSTKDCIAAAKQIEDKYSDIIPVTIHKQQKPFVGGAVQEGIAMAQGSHVVLMSSDLETDPHLIQEFIRIEKKNPEKIVTATRWKKGGGFQGYNKVKLVANCIFQRLIACLFWVNLSDITYAYRIFPKELMQSIRWEELKHPFFLETALKPLRLGVKFIEIPVKWQARTEGVSQNSFWANFKYFPTAWHVRFMKKSDILVSEPQPQLHAENAAGLQRSKLTGV